MEIEVLANNIGIYFRWKEEDAHKLQWRTVVTTVDEMGYMEFPGTIPNKYLEKIEALIDFGVVEWRAIGPEDSEVFMTDEWFGKLNLKEAFRHLKEGWQEYGVDV